MVRGRSACGRGRGLDLAVGGLLQVVGGDRGQVRGVEFGEGFVEGVDLRGAFGSFSGQVFVDFFEEVFVAGFCRIGFHAVGEAVIEAGGVA